MKKTVLRSGLLIAVILPVTALARIDYVQTVNNACGYAAVNDCADCHDTNNYAAQTIAKDLYIADGACGFCPEVPSCNTTPPAPGGSGGDVLALAQQTTRDYFETLFSQFMSYMQVAGGDFAEVFQYCPQIAPEIASDFSRSTGYLVRRVTEKTRNSRNTPDSWELAQLRRFAQMSAAGEPRTQFDITKPDGTILPTKEYEIYEVVYEPDVNGKDRDDDDDDDGHKGKRKGKHEEKYSGKHKADNMNAAAEPRAYFRYMRSITMPGMPPEPPNLPCLKCHGSVPDQVSQQVADEIVKYYPYDQALGYKKGDIRGAWSVKIPLTTTP